MIIEIAKYSLLVIFPVPERMDRIVVGVVVHSSLGWDISLSSDHTKVLALDPNFSIPTLGRIGNTLREIAVSSKKLDDFRSLINLMGGSVQVDSFEGRFAFEDEASYNDQLNRIMAESVVAPSKLIDSGAKRDRSQLKANLKRQFTRLGVFGENSDDINSHKVIARYPIQADQGLFADFALKNSVMHVTETIDFTMATSAYTAKRYEAQAKCLVLKAASDICGPDTRKYVVVAGGNTRNAESALRLLSANAEMFQFENAIDMTRYIDTINSAANGHPTLN